MSDASQTGGCACGEVRFETRGEPYRVGVCHCMTCRKVHGAPFNFYVVFPIDAVTITGEVKVFESSEHGRRFACASCSAPVYSHYDRPDEIDLYPGSFDKPNFWMPTYELWTKRREPWLPKISTIVRCYEESRPKWRRTEQD